MLPFEYLTDQYNKSSLSRILESIYKHIDNVQLRLNVRMNGLEKKIDAAEVAIPSIPTKYSGPLPVPEGLQATKLWKFIWARINRLSRWKLWKVGRIEWQISTNLDFPDTDETVTIDTLRCRMFHVMDINTTYYVRCRYISKKLGAEGLWCEPVTVSGWEPFTASGSLTTESSGTTTGDIDAADEGGVWSTRIIPRLLSTYNLYIGTSLKKWKTIYFYADEAVAHIPEVSLHTGNVDVSTTANSILTAMNDSAAYIVVTETVSNPSRTVITMSPNGIGFFGANPLWRPEVTGARNNPEAALKNLLIALDELGIITDNTTST